ncbi:MAG: hypothetical protein WBP59_06550, partial [Ilumatobacteraceae bacterium]
MATIDRYVDVTCARVAPHPTDHPRRISVIEIDLIDGPVRIAGIVETEPTDAGLSLHRLPAWARRRYDDVSLDLLQTMPAGGRLELVTDGTAPGVLELDVHLTL